MSAASTEPPSLADSLELVFPALPPELVGGDALPWLRSVAAVLPPVHRAGFECRLGADAGEVDLQQGIFAQDGEPAELARFLAASAADGDVWPEVRRLAERWSTAEDPLSAGLEEVWLELDASSSDLGQPLALAGLAPSVFGLIRHATPDASLSVALAFLDALLGEDAAPRAADTVRRCAAVCPADARVSHIGVMLGRPLAAVRVHVSPLPAAAMVPYLKALKWPGNPDAIKAHAMVLLDYVDLVVLCLDILDGRLVRLGLEGSFASNHGLNPGWPGLLGRLTELGMCSSEKASALVGWPGAITPLTAPGPWPDDLIVRGLTRSEAALGVLDRRLSHVKLTCLPGQAPSAKAYFGWGYVWTMPHSAATERRERRLTPAAGVGEAIEAAVGYLLRARHQSGWWRDFFRTSVGFSDEWVTAYVGDALASTAHPAARAAAREAFELLLTRRGSASGWGWNVVLPADGDGTTWALRLARSLAQSKRDRVAAGQSLLGAWTDPEGGVASYAAAAVPPLDEILQIGGDYASWRAAHLCITAPAAVLGSSLTLSYLRATQNPDGSWSSYWWDEDEYATAWAVQALAEHTPGRDGDAIAAAVAWCGRRIGADGAARACADGEPSAFATALALCAICAGTAGGNGSVPVRAAERARRWLLERQLKDGSWERSARLRVPEPSAHDPSAGPESIMYYIPDRGVWTTATVLAALAAPYSRA